MLFLLDYNINKDKVNICITIIERGKWTYEALEEPMDVIESEITSLKQTNIH
jgi:hypothetical protein